jgi:hypothetical protein
MGLNDKNIGTYSQAIKKVIALKKIIMDTIDEIQEVRKLCRYCDKNPLAYFGQSYDSTVTEPITHTDLTTTLTTVTNEGERILFSGIFNENTIGEKSIMIFVTPKVLDVGKTINQYLYEIDILVPQEYNELADYWSERIYSIADYIIQKLDNVTVEDKELVNLVGNVKFEVMGKIIPSRLTTNTSHILLPIPVVVRSIGMRGDNE